MGGWYIVVGKNPMIVIKDLECFVGYFLKAVRKFENYLGADFQWKDKSEKCQLWGQKTYTKWCFDKLQTILGELLKELINPWSRMINLEVDTTAESDEKEVKIYQSMVCVLQWLVTLGCFDIQVAVVMMSQFRAAPRIGHP